MPKGKVGALEATLQYLKNKLPQTGFFSTLDELIANAPFEKAPLEQWRNYLKPGRTFEREGVRFPLKQEELDYTLNHSNFEKQFWTTPTGGFDPKRPITKDDLRQRVQIYRPSFNMTIGTEPGGSARPRLDPELALGRERLWSDRNLLTDAQYRDYAHPTAPGNYEESMILSPDFGRYDTHFGDMVLSHSRTTQQPTTDDKLMRLVEEIQSDRHQDAAEKAYPTRALRDEATNLRINLEHEAHPERAISPYFRDSIPSVPPTPEELEQMSLRLAELEGMQRRRGYRTPQDEELVREMDRRGTELERRRDYDLGQLHRDPRRPDIVARQQELDDLNQRVTEIRDRVPDAPFKDPADYALLELKNQLLNASKENSDYLGLVRGEDISKRFSHAPEQAEGTAYTYDKVYQSALDKLARQYGIKRVDVPAKLQIVGDVATPTMRALETETVPDFMDMIHSHIEDTMGEGNEIPRYMDELINELENSTGLSAPADRARRALEYAREEVLKLNGVDRPDFKEAWNVIQRQLGAMHRVHANAIRQSGAIAQPKTFPALSLTPEIREKILKAGVPIWALGATGAVGSMMQDDDQGYAKGGKVIGAKRMLDWLKLVLKDKVPRQHDYPIENSPEFWNILHEANWNPLVTPSDFELMEASHFPYENIRDPLVDLFPEFKGKSVNNDLQRLVEKYGIDFPKDVPVYRGLNLPKGDYEEAASKSTGERVLPAEIAHSTTLDPGIATGYAFRGEGYPLLLRGRAKEGVRALPRPFLSQDEFMLAPETAFLKEDEAPGVLSTLLTPGYAEGGEIEQRKPVKSLQWLSKIVQMMATGDTGVPDPEKQKRLALLAAGLASQVYGLDYEGNPKFLGDYSRQGHVATGSDGTEYWVPSEDPRPPGVAEEFAALGTLLGSHAPERSKIAEQRLEILKQRILDDMGLEAPKSLGQNIAYAGGTMLGQLPIGGGEAIAEKTVLNPGLINRLKALGTAAVKAPIEWFSPTVKPSLYNYGSGALFGGSLSTLVDSLPESDETSLEDMVRDSEVKQKKAEGGEVNIKESVKPLREMLDELRDRYNALAGDRNAFKEQEATPPDGGG